MTHPAIRAVVCVGPTETWYLRAGTGPAVLLLTADAAARETVLRSLAADARVTAPEPPPQILDVAAAPGALTFAVWLRGFLEGLGTVPVAIVADEAFADAAREFALAEEHRLGSRIPVSVAA